MRSIMSVSFRVLGVGLFLLCASCAYPISTQLRDEAKKDNVPFPEALEDPAAYEGRVVVWGGKIIETINRRDGTDIIVIDAPLDSWLEPHATKQTRGRFIARSAEFLDPALYEKDREVTLAGEITGAEERPLGETSYRYPVVQIKELHLWERRYYYYYPPDYYWYPSFFWYPSFYGSFYYSSAHFHHGHGGHGGGHHGEGHHGEGHHH